MIGTCRIKYMLNGRYVDVFESKYMFEGKGLIILWATGCRVILKTFSNNTIN